MKRAGFILVFMMTIAGFLCAGGRSNTAPGTGPAKLSYYSAMSRAASGHKTLATHPAWIEMQKRLNIELEFRSPAVGNETEGFNLMIASRDLPDIITYGWLTVPGGPARYIQDDVIIKLNDVIDRYAPDVKKAFAKFPVGKREATLDDGTLYCFPQIYANDALAFQWGPMIRRDLLGKVNGVDVSKFPGSMETIEEWERMLTAVKNSGLKGDSGHDIIPFSFVMNVDWYNSGVIVGAYGITSRFTQENGNPVYGPADPRYRDYLTLMKRWYDNGLIDKEFAANTMAMLDAKALDNRVFAFTGSMGNNITRYTGLARPKNPAFLLNTTTYPVLKKGDKPVIVFRTNDFNGNGAAITTACKNIEAAAKLLNYDYSDEGYILLNFGIEGYTFNWDTSGGYVTQLVSSTHAGYPRYTELMTNNPEGYSRDITTGIFIRAGDWGGVKAGEFLEQRDSLPEQLGPNGRALWMIPPKVRVPAVLPTAAESTEFARIMNEVNTYADEMTIKFIMGEEPLSKFDDFVQTQRRMGIDRAREIMRAQIDRYNKRP